jgi:HK97 family phage major capsid protein
MYGSITELPDNIQSDCSDQEQGEYLRVYNLVYGQTNDATKATAAAWGWVKKMRVQGVAVMKTAKNGDPVIGGWAMHFSNGREDKDFHDTYFSRASRLMLEYYQGAPLWMEHGLDNRYWDVPIGKRQNVGIFGYGVWIDHALHRSHEMFDETYRGAENGEFSYSSDSIGHYVERGFNPVDGRLDSWPFAGCSLTRDPAEPGLGFVSPQVFLGALKSAIQFKQNGTEAREAQRTGTRKTYFVSIKKQGVTSMDPQMLADLAAFLGCEATPEAVAAALQDLMTQLQATPTAEPEVAAQSELVASLAPALGLPAAASKSDVAAKVEQIKAMLAEPAGAGAGRSLNVGALKRFTARANELLDEPEEDRLPFYVGDDEDSDEDEEPQRTPARKTSNRSKRFGQRGAQVGKSKAPGIVQMLRDINPQTPSSMKSAKAQSYGIGPTGGFILNHETAKEILPALRDALPLYDMGVQEYTMDGVESLTIPKDGAEHEAYWVGDGAEIPESEDKVGGLVLFPRPLAARVIIPNKFLANSTVNYEQRVREKITYRIQRAIMRAALYGTGGVSGANVGVQPTGLAVLAGMAGRTVTKTTLATNGARPTIKDMSAAIGRIEDANVELNESTAFLFSPRTKRTFVNMAATDGQPLLRDSWASGEDGALLGYNWQTTNLISNAETVGSSAVTSTIFAGVWSHMALGISNQFEFLVDPYSRASYLQTVIIASTYADVAVLYDEAFEVLVGALE